MREMIRVRVNPCYKPNEIGGIKENKKGITACVCVVLAGGVGPMNSSSMCVFWKWSKCHSEHSGCGV